MSGPWAEEAQLYVRTSVEVMLWPLQTCRGSGAAMIECAECDSGELLVAGPVDRPFVLADLVARVESHMAGCSRPRNVAQTAAAERLTPEEHTPEQVAETFAIRADDAWDMVLKAPEHRNTLPAGFCQDNEYVT